MTVLPRPGFAIKRDAARLLDPQVAQQPLSKRPPHALSSSGLREEQEEEREAEYHRGHDPRHGEVVPVRGRTCMVTTEVHKARTGQNRRRFQHGPLYPAGEVYTGMMGDLS